MISNKEIKKVIGLVDVIMENSRKEGLAPEAAAIGIVEYFKRKNQLDLLRKIISIHRLKDGDKRKIEITLSRKFGDEFMDSLEKDALDVVKKEEDFFAREKPVFEVKTDPSLIGGIKVKTGNYLFDFSLSKILWNK